MIKQAIILCGGEGTRVKEITGNTPKCLFSISNRPFIFYIIMMCKGIGATDIVLLARDKAPKFKFFEDGIADIHKHSGLDFNDSPNGIPLPRGLVRVIGYTGEGVTEEILSIPKLDDIFILAQGDQLPIGNWQGFVADGKPKIGIKIIGRDAGIAILKKEMLIKKEINPLDFKDMRKKLPEYLMLGTVHMGTPEGIRRAIQFFDMVVYGQ